ncbi:MAG: NADH-cytochrome b5 reductase [Thelocarpon superellum]|nr:MAG: NADH-cytochrome b5 reductase [Thelocarpon superellum]
MVKALTFKGDKKSKKRKRPPPQEGADPSEETAVTRSSEAQAGEDDSWVTAEAPSDVVGPVIFVLPSDEPSCIACDANGKVFSSKLENLIEGDPATAEPHDVRQVWIANRVAGTEGHTFKGHHGRYLGCDKFGILSASREAVSPAESFTCIATPDTPGSLSIQSMRETFLSITPTGALPEIRGDAAEITFNATFRVRMQARFKPRLKANKEEKAREKISRKELEEVVGRRLNDEEARKLKKARREGNYHEAILDNVRRYATEPSKGGSNTALIGGLVAAAGVGAYYFLSSGGQTIKAPAAATSIAETASGVASTFTGGDQGWVSLKLKDVENINHNTKRFRFELPEKEHVSGLHIASAILTKHQGPKDEKPVIRPYTPVSDEDEAGFLDLLVKRYPNGPMSEHLHDMKPDQRLEFKGPIPKYPWEANKHEHIALIAGGTGITPMYQLCRAIFKNPNDKTNVTLVFGNISEEDILLKHEFEELENMYPQRFRAFYVLDSPPEKWMQGKGRIDKNLLKTVLPEPKSGNVKIFVCGPPGLYKAISGTKTSPKDQGELSGILKELGYSEEQVYKF